MQEAGEPRARVPAVLAAVAVLAAGLSACDSDPLGTEPGESMVTLLFEAAGDPQASGATAPADAGLSSARTVEGTNGTLVLETMHVIVEEVELEGTAEIELGPYFTEIPLNEGAGIEVFSEPVPAGNYEEFELEIAADDDILEEVRQEMTYWPEDASLRITGVFEPEGGSPQEFLVFLDAEIEVEFEFEPYLAVSEQDRTVAITVNPSLWFQRGDGSVVDLTRYHCDPPTTCPLPEFEAEIEREGGEVFTEIEWN